jgi:hypothetical protein
MKKLRVMVLIFAMIFVAGYAYAESIWFSPLTAIPVGPAGPPSDLIVTPYCCPSTAIKVTASQMVTDNDSQWVLIGLTAQENKAIKAVQVCYQVDTSSPGSTFISQVRLTKMTGPGEALVIHDDSTDLIATNATCYTSNTVKPKPKVSGAITLGLKMVFGSTSDKIRIGGVKLIY